VRTIGWSAAALLAVALGGCADEAMTPSALASKQDIAAKGLKFFDEIDEAKLAQDAGIAARPATLLVFGNPALGTSSSRPTRNPASTGRCACWSTRMQAAKSEPNTPISTTSSKATASKTAARSSKRRPR